jgi:hypothetical protein
MNSEYVSLIIMRAKVLARANLCSLGHIGRLVTVRDDFPADEI